MKYQNLARLLCRLRSDHSRCNSTNRQNPPIQQNLLDFGTKDAILIFFEIKNALNLCNMTNFITKTTISNCLGIAAMGQRGWLNQLINKHMNNMGVCRAAPDFAHVWKNAKSFATLKNAQIILSEEVGEGPQLNQQSLVMASQSSLYKTVGKVLVWWLQ